MAFDFNNLFATGQLGGAINSMPMAGGGAAEMKAPNLVAAFGNIVGLNANAPQKHILDALLPSTAQGSWLDKKPGGWASQRRGGPRDAWVQSGHQALFTDNKAGSTLGQGVHIEAAPISAPGGSDSGLGNMASMGHNHQGVGKEVHGTAHVGQIAANQGTGQFNINNSTQHIQGAQFSAFPGVFEIGSRANSVAIASGMFAMRSNFDSQHVIALDHPIGHPIEAPIIRAPDGGGRGVG